MNSAKKREFALGIIIIAGSLIYLLMTANLPKKAFIDAAFVPYVLGTIMFVLGVMQLRAAKKFQPKAASEKTEEPIDYPTVLKTVGLIVGYTALMPWVGFPIMTVIYLFTQFIVLTPANKKMNYVLYGVIAVISSAAIFLTFRYAFDMLLPTGLLG